MQAHILLRGLIAVSVISTSPLAPADTLTIDQSKPDVFANALCNPTAGCKSCVNPASFARCASDLRQINLSQQRHYIAPKLDQKAIRAEALRFIPVCKTSGFYIALGVCNLVWHIASNGANKEYVACPQSNIRVPNAAWCPTIQINPSGIPETPLMDPSSLINSSMGGTMSPSPGGTMSPSPGGTMSPSPGGTMSPSPGGTMSPSPGGTMSPNP